MAVRHALLARDKIRPLRPGQKITERSITAESWSTVTCVIRSSTGGA